MLDDEVEYLGSRPAKPPSVSDPMTHHRPVTGITVHVEKSGSAPAYDLSFHKADSRVVQIGRRPGTDIDKYDPGKAMFRCPVVSRKHAKITFTDAGSVYLFDLQSHHGTHVRKPDETMSTPLLSETPYLLVGGEIVTLGKSVGKGEDLVRPVVFTIEIQYSQSNPSAQLIDLTRSASSERQVSPPIKICALKTSGRYGLNDSSSSSPSSDEMSSSYTSGNTSDIEEISSTSSHEKGKCTPVPHSSHIGHAIEVLRSLIPPLHPPSLPSQRSQSPGEQSPLLVFPPMNLPTLNSYYHRPRHFPTSPPFDLPPLSVALSEKTPESFDWDKPYGHDASPRSDKSRSTSPMDLGSPSPAPASEKQAYPPLDICGWSIGRAPSCDPSISSLYVECGLDAMSAALSGASEERSAPAEQEAEPVSISTPRSLGHSAEEEDRASTRSKVVNEMEAELSFLSAFVEDLKVDLTKLQSSQQDIQSRVNTDIDATSERLTRFEQCMTDLNFGLSKVEGSCNANASNIQEVKSLLSNMQRDLTFFGDAAKSASEASEQYDQQNERRDVTESIETLRQLISEMKDLRDNTRQQMTAELDLVKSARNTVLNDIQRMRVLPTENQVCQMFISRLHAALISHTHPMLVDMGFSSEPSHSQVVEAQARR
ncbi:hypothetical protein JOM56_005002 [Amanita muscaria]